MEHCYVEFTHHGGASLERLEKFVGTVKSEKDLTAAEVDKSWIHFFTEDEMAGFWWPAKDKVEQVRKAWGDVPVFRIADRKMKRDWDIYSMFTVLRECEYVLVGVREVGPVLYRVEFDPAGYPFGGTGSLQRTVAALGGTVVVVDDGTGRVEMRQKPWWKFWQKR